MTSTKELKTMCNEDVVAYFNVPERYELTEGTEEKQAKTLGQSSRPKFETDNSRTQAGDNLLDDTS